MPIIPKSFRDVVLAPSSAGRGDAMQMSFRDRASAMEFLRELSMDRDGEAQIRRLLRDLDPTFDASRATKESVLQALASHIAMGRLTVAAKNRPITVFAAAGSADSATAAGDSAEAAAEAAADAAAADAAAQTGETTTTAAEALEAAGAQPAEEIAPASAEATAAAEAAAAANADFATAEAETQAAVLQTAAGVGAPFCEECAKAAEEEEAAATEEVLPDEEPETPAEDPATERVVMAEAAANSDVSDVDAEAQAATLQEAAEEGVPFCEECEKLRKAEAEDEAESETATADAGASE